MFDLDDCYECQQVRNEKVNIDISQDLNLKTFTRICFEKKSSAIS